MTATPARQLLPRRERQESILNGAAQAFARKGFAGTSMAEVAAASGITKLIVYRHFDSKEELYRAVLDRTFQLLVHQLAQGVARSEPTPGLVALFEVARAYPDGVRLLLVHAPREPAFADYAAGIRARIVKRTQRKVTLRDPALRRWEAELTVSYVFEAVLSWLDFGEPKQDEVFLSRCRAGLMGMTQAWRRNER